MEISFLINNQINDDFCLKMVNHTQICTNLGLSLIILGWYLPIISP